MKWVECGHMGPQPAAVAGQSPAESSSQNQAEGAVWSPLVEEGQSTGEAAAQGKLALDQKEVYTSSGTLNSHTEALMSRNVRNHK